MIYWNVPFIGCAETEDCHGYCPACGDGRVSYSSSGNPVEPSNRRAFPRIAYAAAHVVADPLAMTNPWPKPAVDWDATLAFRHHLWWLGFRIAEAMDTSQRGMGFDWTNAQELIRRSIAEARSVDGADLASGAGTDQLTPAAAGSLDDVIAAYEEQFAFIEGAGRPGDHDGQPRAGGGRQSARTTMSASTTASSARPPAR